jgi:hypothetical protein
MASGELKVAWFILGAMAWPIFRGELAWLVIARVSSLNGERRVRPPGA